MPSTEPRLDALDAIRTQHLQIRPLTPQDAQAFRAMTDTPSITENVHFLETPFTLPQARALIGTARDGSHCFWGVWKDAELVGTVGTHLQPGDEIEIGYWFAEAARGQGLASQAVAAALARLADAYPRRRITAECRPDNRASWRLLERAGFVADGTDGHRAGRKRLVFRTA